MKKAVALMDHNHKSTIVAHGMLSVKYFNNLFFSLNNFSELLSIKKNLIL